MRIIPIYKFSVLCYTKATPEGNTFEKAAHAGDTGGRHGETGEFQPEADGDPQRAAGDHRPPPDLSLGTVYRNLKKFCETGKAASVGVIGGQEDFDANTTPHAHLVCDSCGAVVDVFQEFFPQEELQTLSQDLACRIQGAQVTFRGLCPNCSKETPQS